MEIFSALHGKVASIAIDANANLDLPGQEIGADEIQALDLIGGKDNRVVFRDASYPWHLNGYIDYKAGHNGSGILIGKRLVLTCYHCIDFKQGTEMNEMYFIPARYSQVPAGQSENPYGKFKVKNAYWFGAGRPTTGTNNYGAMDFAVLELEDPSGLGYAGFNIFKKEWIANTAWYHIGYPSYNKYALNNLVQGRPIYQTDIKVIDFKDFDYTDSAGVNWAVQKVFTDADIEGGQSGGALFRIENNIVMVSALLGGAGSTDTGGAACGQLMVQLINWCRTNLDQ